MGPSAMLVLSLALLAASFSLPTASCLALGQAQQGLGQSGSGRSSSRAGIRYSPRAELDRVASMPGWGSLSTFAMFSGYITVDAAAGRALFYVLVESEGNPATDPLLLWLNGSLGGGFMSELGPFLPQKDGKTLQANPYPWNRAASVLFLESPAFVGWSYSNTSADRIVGDARTAKDSYMFLLGLMERFPHLRSNDLYLSGESYAGHYVPNLAREIVRGNLEAVHKEAGPLNLRGFLVGNAWTDTAIDNLGAVDFWWHHAMVSDEAAAGIRLHCNFSKIGPLDAPRLPQDPSVRLGKDLCSDFCDRAFAELGPINIYEIYADVCLPKPAASEAAVLADLLGAHPAGLTARFAAQFSSGSGSRSRSTASLGSRARRLMHAVDAASASAAPAGRLSASAGSGSGSGSGILGEIPGDPPGYDPCVDDEVEVYMNLPEVQKALHANQSVILPWRWQDCSGHTVLHYSRDDLLASMLPVYDELLATANLRILIFSGDVDGIVPLVGTRRWIAGLGLPVKTAWRPWLSGTGQVAGRIVEYEGITFASVRNAGHMVPYVQPERMFHLLTAFLAGTPP